MPWDGAGNFTRDNGVNTGDNAWEQDKNAGVKIVTSRHDYHDTDIADGVDNCLTKDGQNSPTANLPMAGQKHTGAAVATANGEYVAFDQFTWSSWTPTITPFGSMTYTGVTIPHARYIQINKFVWFMISFSGTVGGTPTNRIKFSLPVTAVNQGNALNGSLVDNGIIVASVATYASTTELDVYRYDNANYTAGVVTPNVQGFYEAA